MCLLLYVSDQQHKNKSLDVHRHTAHHSDNIFTYVEQIRNICFVRPHKMITHTHTQPKTMYKFAPFQNLNLIQFYQVLTYLYQSECTHHTYEYSGIENAARRDRACILYEYFMSFPNECILCTLENIHKHTKPPPPPTF